MPWHRPHFAWATYGSVPGGALWRPVPAGGLRPPLQHSLPHSPRRCRNLAHRLRRGTGPSAVPSVPSEAAPRGRKPHRTLSLGAPLRSWSLTARPCFAPSLADVPTPPPPLPNIGSLDLSSVRAERDKVKPLNGEFKLETGEIPMSPRAQTDAVLETPRTAMGRKDAVTSKFFSVRTPAPVSARPFSPSSCSVVARTSCLISLFSLLWCGRRRSCMAWDRWRSHRMEMCTPRSVSMASSRCGRLVHHKMAPRCAALPGSDG